MRVASRGLGYGTALAAVAMLLPVGGAVTPVSAAQAPAVPVLDWQPCGDDFPGIDCATARVPLDYDRPRGATTTIALARVPASDNAHRIGSVFLNPGGPGGSGVGFVLGGVGSAVAEALDGRFDVVGFDPRGVGSSDPLHCFGSEDELNEFFAGLPLFPYRAPQYQPFYERYRSLAGECLEDRQAVARHMSTADVARDLDLLRRAVGDRRLTYLGFSYGSYLGMTYANLFPRNVRALVIDGVLDPRLWSSGWQIRSDRVATQQEFDEFLRLCDAAGAQVRGSAPAGSRARWEALARALRRGPVDLGDGFLYTYDLLIGDATGAMYAPEIWGGDEGYAAFLDFVADAALGDQAAARQARALRDRMEVQLAAPQADETDYDNGLDAYFGNQCADTQYPHTFLGFLAVDLYARAGSRFGPLWWWFNNGCTAWPVASDRYVGPWSARTSAPVLVVGNYFDGVTAYTGAQAAARLLPNSRLLTYAGWGHTAYLRNECTANHVNAYLLDGRLPAAGTVCPANPNPFVAAAARRGPPSVPLVGRPPARPIGR